MTIHNDHEAYPDLGITSEDRNNPSAIIDLLSALDKTLPELPADPTVEPKNPPQNQK